MEIAHRQFNRVDLLTLSGRVDARTAPDLKQYIDTLFEEGRCRLVLDVARVEHISSAGLRVLIDARKRARDWKLTDLEGGDVRIASAPDRIKDVFNLTGLTTLFALFEDTTEAVGSF
jgi:anti-sigma B factor antagonist